MGYLLVSTYIVELLWNRTVSIPSEAPFFELLKK